MCAGRSAASSAEKIRRSFRIHPALRPFAWPPCPVVPSVVHADVGKLSRQHEGFGPDPRTMTIAGRGIPLSWWESIVTGRTVRDTRVCGQYPRFAWKPRRGSCPGGGSSSDESQLQVRMLAHFVHNIVAQCDEKELSAFASGEFHRWDEIAVSGHQDNHVDLLLQRKRCNVEADSHIDALLVNVRHQIL